MLKGLQNLLLYLQAGRRIYDFRRAASGAAPAAAGPGALPELYIEGFDAEQIWLQLELAAGPALKRARKLLRKVGQEPQLLTPETEEALDGGCWEGGAVWVFEQWGAGGGRLPPISSLLTGRKGG